MAAATVADTVVMPLNLNIMTEIIEAGRPDALLPNLGGQTGLCCRKPAFRRGVVVLCYQMQVLLGLGIFLWSGKLALQLGILSTFSAFPRMESGNPCALLISTSLSKGFFVLQIAIYSSGVMS